MFDDDLTVEDMYDSNLFGLRSLSHGGTGVAMEFDQLTECRPSTEKERKWAV
jgi:hypothetical protein